MRSSIARGYLIHPAPVHQKNRHRGLTRLPQWQSLRCRQRRRAQGVDWQSAAYDPASAHLMLALVGIMTDDDEELQMWRECC